MILITKAESKELVKLGYKFGHDGLLHKSFSRHPKYYLTEDRRALNALNNIRQNHIIETVE